MSKNKITWESKVGFGKNADLTLLNLLIVDKPYLKWCFENDLHVTNPKIKFIYDNITEKKFDIIMNSRKN